MTSYYALELLENSIELYQFDVDDHGRVVHRWEINPVFASLEIVKPRRVFTPGEVVDMMDLGDRHPQTIDELRESYPEATTDREAAFAALIEVWRTCLQFCTVEAQGRVLGSPEDPEGRQRGIPLTIKTLFSMRKGEIESNPLIRAMLER